MNIIFSWQYTAGSTGYPSFVAASRVQNSLACASCHSNETIRDCYKTRSFPLKDNKGFS